MSKKIMIIGVLWEQLPLVEKAKELGLKTIVTTIWDKNKIDADVIYEIDSRNLEKLEEVYIKEKPDAIIADECDYSTYAVAFLTDKYNLPGPSLYPLTVTNNKFLQRSLVGETDVHQPQYQLCWNYECVKSAANKIGFPVILKPIDNRGSIGVLIAESEDTLRDAWFNSVSNSHSRMCIVEEFIKGGHIAVDGFVDSKKFHALCVSTKQKYPESIILDKILHFPGFLDEKKVEEAIETVKKIINAIKIGYGFIHAEFIIQEETKKIYLLEIANRGGGVHISNKILPQITGIDIQKAFIEMALGKEINLEWEGKHINKVLIYFVNPQGDKTPKQIVDQYKEKLLALWIKPKKTLKNIKTLGALGRAGMGILWGDNFKELNEMGIKIEKDISNVEQEFYWGGKYYGS